MGDVNQESALQFLCRTLNKPSLVGLNPLLFKSGPVEKEIIEISGRPGSGKTFLLLNLVRKCILPKAYMDRSLPGLGAKVVYINTDMHLNVIKLAEYLETDVTKVFNDKDIVNKVIEESLNRLSIINVYDSLGFQSCFAALKSLLCQDGSISLVAIDSISAFYWQDSFFGLKKMDSHIVEMLKLVHQYLTPFRVAVVYTKPDYFKSKLNARDESGPNDLYKANVKIHLRPPPDNFATITDKSGNSKCHYSFHNSGIIWST